MIFDLRLVDQAVLVLENNSGQDTKANGSILLEKVGQVHTCSFYGTYTVVHSCNSA